MTIEIIESKRDGGWAVESISDSGEISRVLFTGQDDEAKAREYFAWLMAKCSAKE